MMPGLEHTLAPRGSCIRDLPAPGRFEACFRSSRLIEVRDNWLVFLAVDTECPRPQEEIEARCATPLFQLCSTEALVAVVKAACSIKYSAQQNTVSTSFNESCLRALQRSLDAVVPHFR